MSLKKQHTHTPKKKKKNLTLCDMPLSHTHTRKHTCAWVCVCVCVTQYAHNANPCIFSYLTQAKLTQTIRRSMLVRSKPWSGNGGLSSTRRLWGKREQTSLSVTCRWVSTHMRSCSVSQVLQSVCIQRSCSQPVSKAVIRQSVKHSVRFSDQSIGKSIHPSIDESINQPINQLVVGYHIYVKPKVPSAETPQLSKVLLWSSSTVCQNNSLACFDRC